MTIGTPRLHQQNVELFAKLNKEMKSLQEQVGSGKADLKLSENLYDISKRFASVKLTFAVNSLAFNSLDFASTLPIIVGFRVPDETSIKSSP